MPHGQPFVALAIVTAAAATASAQSYTLSSPSSEANGRFGSAVAAVPDVNNDGRGEMAVGAPNEDVAAVNETGRVYLYSAYGLRRLTLTSPSPENGGKFGFSVAGVPDVNGDNFGDLIAGAPFENPGGSPADSGRAYVFSGASGVRRLTLVSPNAEVGGLFGWSVAGIADITGDGKGDVAIGAPRENPGFTPADNGRVYLFNGFTGNLIRTLSSPNQESNGGFGTAIAAVPDLDGDGKGDIVVGALFEDPGAAPDSAGRAYVFSGASGTLLHTLASPVQQSGGFFGNAVSGVPDVNGDSGGDILVGAPYEKIGNQPDGSGRVYLYNGSTGALLRQFATGAPVTNDIFGFAVSGCPDLNGDSRGDVIIGAKGKTVQGSPANAGRVYLYSGATGAFIKTLLSPNQQLEGEFGASVAGLSNISGDGKGNPGVGAPKEDLPAKIDAGRAYMFR